MKAIETRYKGYRFRSRLEARWAVFFDALGGKWEYEKEGFDINGRWYLPDFWFPTLQCFGEVKPAAFTAEEFRLARACKSILLEGAPEVKFYKSVDADACFACYLLETKRQERCDEHRCIHPDIHGHCKEDGYCQGEDRIACWEPLHRFIHFPASFGKGRLWSSFGEDCASYDNRDFFNAVHRARGARFEHGEQPS